MIVLQGVKGYGPVVNLQAASPIGRARLFLAGLSTPLTDPLDILAATEAYALWLQSGLDQVTDVFAFTLRSSADALRNWNSAGPAATNNGAVWTTNEGFAGNGTNHWINTGLTPLSGGTRYTLNGAHMATFSFDATGDTTNPTMGFQNSLLSILYPTTPGGNSGWRVNQTATRAALNPTRSRGSMIVNRTSGTVLRALSNGVRIDGNNSGVDASEIPPGNVTVLRGNTVFSTAKVAGWSVGGALTAAQEQALTRVFAILAGRFAPLP